MKLALVLAAAIAVLPTFSRAESGWCKTLFESVPAELGGHPVAERTDFGSSEQGSSVVYDLTPPEVLAVDIFDGGVENFTEAEVEREFFLSAQKLVAGNKARGRRPAGKPVFHRIETDPHGEPVVYRMTLAGETDTIPAILDVMSLFQYGDCLIRLRLTAISEDPVAVEQVAADAVGGLLAGLPALP